MKFRKILRRSDQPDLFVRHSNNNELSLDEQRIQTESKIKLLEADFCQLTGQSFSRDLQEDQLSKDARKCYNAIRFHLSLISKIGLVPPEVWERVFEFVVLTKPDVDRQYVESLCRVSRGWRAIVVGYPILWSRFPAFSYGGDSRIPNKKYKKDIQRLELYLSRSKNTPITFKYRYKFGDVTTWDLDKEKVFKMLLVLVEVAHRWESVRIEGPGETMRAVSLVKGKLPLLSTLVLILALPYSEEIRVDCFKSAPLLRHVELSASFQKREPQQTQGRLRISLPLSRLEKFRTIILLDTSYPSLFQDSYHSLIKLEYQIGSRTGRILAIPKATFSRLTKLYVTQYHGGVPIQPRDVLRHLMQLTLPSLTHLKVYDFHFRPSDRLYEIVIHLIRRSGCSLKNLRLDPNAGPESVTQFVDLLKLCPELEFMDVQTPTEEILQQFVLNRASPAPLIPKLKTLVFRPPRGTEWTILRKSVFVDPLNFMRVVRSRTQDLFEPDQPISGGETFHCLEEVRIMLPSSDGRSPSSGQLALFEDAALPPFDIKPEDGVVRVGRQEATPYRWCPIAPSAARFKFITDSARKKEEDQPDLAWNDALGCIDCNKPPLTVSGRFGITGVEKGWY
ncbi:hypothetical protein H1R20_g9328, partial [Candolleomyces eurysporus]